MGKYSNIRESFCKEERFIGVCAATESNLVYQNMQVSQNRKNGKEIASKKGIFRFIPTINHGKLYENSFIISVMFKYVFVK